MSRIIALDVGDKRVGVALSDEGLTLSSPLQTFERANGNAEKEILNLIKSHNIQTVVVGIPLSDNGEENAQCEKVKTFSRRLEKRAKINMVYLDEYGSSVEAERRLKLARGRVIEKSLIDAASAAIILQEYLHSMKGTS